MTLVEIFASVLLALFLSVAVFAIYDSVKFHLNRSRLRRENKKHEEDIKKMFKELSDTLEVIAEAEEEEEEPKKKTTAKKTATKKTAKNKTETKKGKSRAGYKGR